MGAGGPRGLKRLLGHICALLGLAALFALTTGPPAASAAGTGLTLEKVGARVVIGDSRYLFMGPAGARSRRATIWDSTTGRTTATTVPGDCADLVFAPGDGNAAAGAGVIFLHCYHGGGENGTGWIYEIAGRHWLQIPGSVMASCGSNGCDFEGAGSQWVELAILPGGCGSEGCGTDPGYLDYDFHNGRTEIGNGGAVGGCLNFAAFECGDLNSRSLDATVFDNACVALPSADDYAPLAGGEIALLSATDALSVQGCSTGRRTLLSARPGALSATSRLLAWQPGSDPYHLDVFNSELARVFRLAVPENVQGDGFTLDGVVGDRVYGDDDAAYYVGTLPAAVTASTR